MTKISTLSTLSSKLLSLLGNFSIIYVFNFLFSYLFFNTPSSYGSRNTRFRYFPGHFRCSSVHLIQDVYIFSGASRRRRPRRCRPRPAHQGVGDAMAGPSPLPSTHGASRPRRRRCHRHRHRRPAVRAEATNRDSDWPRVCRASRTCRKRATCCDVELLGGGMSEAYSSLRVMLFDILQCSFLFVYLTPSSEVQQPEDFRRQHRI